MANNAALIMNILGSFIGDQAPQQNPKYQGIDAEGKYINGESPYASPGFGTKLFHPDVAAQEGNLNNLASQQFLQNTIGNRIGASNAGRTRTAYGKTIGDMSNDELAGMTGNNTTAPTMSSADIVSADSRNNIPNLHSQDLATTLQKGIARNTADIANGLPSKQSAADTASAEFQAPYYQGQQSLIAPKLSYEQGNLGMQTRLLPSEESSRLAQNQFSANNYTAEGQMIQPRLGSELNAIRNRNLGMENEFSQLNVDKQLRPQLESTRANQIVGSNLDSQVGTALSAERNSNIPMLTQMQGQDRANTLWTLMHPPIAPIPYYRDSTGKPASDPSYVNLMNMMNSKLKPDGTSSGPQFTPVGNGLHIGAPTVKKPGAPVPVGTPLGAKTVPEMRAFGMQQTGDDILEQQIKAIKAIPGLWNSLVNTIAPAKKY